MTSLMTFWSRMFAEPATRATVLEFECDTNVLLQASLCLFSPDRGNWGLLLPSFLPQLSGSRGAQEPPDSQRRLLTSIPCVSFLLGLFVLLCPHRIGSPLAGTFKEKGEGTANYSWGSCAGCEALGALGPGANPRPLRPGALCPPDCTLSHPWPLHSPHLYTTCRIPRSRPSAASLPCEVAAQRPWVRECFRL